MKSVDSLIRAPRLTGEDSALEKAFEDSIDGGFVLKSAADGDYRSSFIRYDFDNDGTQEAVVLYTSTIDELTVRMNFLDWTQDSGWHSVKDIKGLAGSVLDVNFVDLDNDGLPELSVVWSLTDSAKDRLLSVYKMVVGGSFDISSVVVQHIASKCFLDIDQDGQNEIFFTDFDTSGTGLAYAEVLKFITPDREDLAADIQILGKTDISTDIASFYSFSFDHYNGDTRVFADCLDSAAEMFTDVIVWNKASGNLTAPLDVDGRSALALTVRGAILTCADFDSDQQIEIPSFQPFRDSTVVSVSATGGEQTGNMKLYTRYKLIGSDLTVDGRYFVDSGNGYMFRISDEIYAACYARFDKTQKRVAFYLRAPDGTADGGSVLFSITAVESVSYHDTEPSLSDETGAVYTHSGAGVEYNVVIPDPANSLGLTYSSVYSMISEIDSTSQFAAAVSAAHL